MNRAAFDGWLETHYGDLRAVARRRTNSDEQADELLQSAVTRLLGVHNKEGELVASRIDFPDQPWTWAVLIVRRVRDDGQEVEEHRQEAEAVQVLSSPAVSLEREGFELVGGPGGVARWRYQQVRDERLFRAAWFADERERFVRAMRRRHHFGESGVPYTEHGWEDRYREVSSAPVKEMSK